MKIDTQNGWFKGLGDLVCFAWIGETILQSGGAVEFFATGWRAEVLRFFQQRVTDIAKDAVCPLVGYETAIKEKSPLNYLEWIASQCNLTDFALQVHFTQDNYCYFSRPRLDLPPMEREMGRKSSATVLVFPEGCWPARVWPRNYYLELCHLLKDAGVNVAVVTEKLAPDFGAFRNIHSQSLAFVAAAMQSAELVIGNDSGPAHLAGTIGTRTLAIHGPTTERIFAHIPDVTSFRKKALTCAGCHCLPPFRDSCSLGCHELYRTFPDDVFREAVQMLWKKPIKRKAMAA